MSLREIAKDRKFRRLVVALAVVFPFQVLSFFSIHLPFPVRLVLFLAVVVIFGKEVFVKGFRSLAKLNFSNINLLMAVAILGALYLRQFEEAAIIVVLFALGNTLETIGVRRSHQALEKLVGETPTAARVKGREGETPVDEVKVGEIIEVRPGDRIPLDGVVVGGCSLVDEAMITGEPLPRNKDKGDPVYGGTINGRGYLEVRVTKEAGDSTLARVIELTRMASGKKAAVQTFIEKFARFYTPSVMIVALLLVTVPVLVLGKPFTHWLTQALTLLVISCPCALVISTPVAVFSALGNASGRGALIKGGRYIEEIGKVGAVAFDKTRTLTVGRPRVSEIIPFGDHTEQDVIACSAGLEAFSSHPLAEGIVEAAREKGIELHSYEEFESVPGKGLKGSCRVCLDSHHCLGNIDFVTEEHEVGKAVVEKVKELEGEGKTAVIISDNQGVNGIIGITDKIREESPSLIAGLEKLGISPVILTGDNQASTGYVAARLGIETFRAGLLPEGKVEELAKLIHKYGRVAMVGDGINDAPALAASSVGIALGAIGSDLAIENADIALMNDKLNLIPYLVKLGRKTAGKVRFNIGFAVTVKFVFLALALGGMSNLVMAIFADVGVTVLVILNSLRLFDFGPDKEL